MAESKEELKKYFGSKRWNPRKVFSVSLPTQQKTQKHEPPIPRGKVEVGAGSTLTPAAPVLVAFRFCRQAERQGANLQSAESPIGRKQEAYAKSNHASPGF